MRNPFRRKKGPKVYTLRGRDIYALMQAVNYYRERDFLAIEEGIVCDSWWRLGFRCKLREMTPDEKAEEIDRRERMKRFRDISRKLQEMSREPIP